MQSINPATGEIIHNYQEYELEQCFESIDQGHQCFSRWRHYSFAQRAQLFNNVANILEKNKSHFAQLMQLEMGKPTAQGEAEIEKCVWVCRYYADNALEFLKPENVDTDFAKSFVTFEPLGVILAIMPWNFPFWQVFRFAAPTLMAGNVGILKHASNVSGCALAIEEVFREAKAPAGLFSTLLVSSKKVEDIIRHPQVRAITLTGSTSAGKEVAKVAGHELKKTVLELGGSDPYVILADADLDKAAKLCAQSRLLNAGQSCISAKRFIVVKECKAEFEKKLVEAMESHPPIGPLARVDLRDDLAKQVEASVNKGAKILLGGSITSGAGAYYPPTILTDVTKGMPAFDEELFGPVAAIIEAQDEAHAIELANDSEYGLGGAIFSGDITKAQELAAHAIDTGSCFVNDYVKSDPRLPFGGVKHSGYGRELSHFGIKEFVNIKTVCVGKD